MAVPEASTADRDHLRGGVLRVRLRRGRHDHAVGSTRRSCSSARSRRARCSRGPRTSRCPPTSGRACRLDGSPMVVAALQASTAPEKAIGILGAEVYDGRATRSNVLAFRAQGPVRRVLPGLDVDRARQEERARRSLHGVVADDLDGHVDGSGAPVKRRRALRDRSDRRHDGRRPRRTSTRSRSIAAVGLVPDCAMGVTATFEGGDRCRSTRRTESCVVQVREPRRHARPARRATTHAVRHRASAATASARCSDEGAQAFLRCRRARRACGDDGGDDPIDARATPDATPASTRSAPTPRASTNSDHARRDHQRVHHRAEDLQGLAPAAPEPGRHAAAAAALIVASRDRCAVRRGRARAACGP